MDIRFPLPHFPAFAHRFRRHLTASLAALGLAAALTQGGAVPLFASARPFGPMTAPEYQLLAIVNTDRQSNGLGQLSANGVLSGIARERSQQMLSGAPFGHYDGSGQLVFTTLLTSQHFPYVYAGENVAMNNYGLGDSLGVANSSLMASPPHRANILDARFNQVGIGIAGPDRNGDFYYTEIFAQVG